MRAAIFKEKGHPLVIEDMPEPIPKEGQVLVKIKACGICGSDIHASETDWTPKNIVMGHEFSGIIAGLGAGVKKWEVGQRVAALLIFPFGYSVQDYDFIIKMMEQERITAKPLISHQIGLAELPTMFEKMKNPTNQCKVIGVPKNFSSN